MYLKLMSDKNLLDGDPSHNFKMVTIGPRDTLDFTEVIRPTYRPEDALPPEGLAKAAPIGGVKEVQATIYREGSSIPETYTLLGTAYVLSESGKTIASRASY